LKAGCAPGVVTSDNTFTMEGASGKGLVGVDVVASNQPCDYPAFRKRRLIYRSYRCGWLAAFSAYSGGALLSAFAINGILSVFSLNSFLSIASTNSCLSIFSVNSFCAIGCASEAFKVCWTS